MKWFRNWKKLKTSCVCLSPAMALFYTETPSLLNEILLFIPLVWVEALRWDSKQSPCCINKSGILVVTGQGVYKEGVFPWIPIEVSVNTNKDETITDWALQILTIWGLSESLVVSLVHVYCFRNKQLRDEGWDVSHWDMLPTSFYLGKWSISINAFRAQTLTDFIRTAYAENLWTSYATGRLANLLEAIVILNVSHEWTKYFLLNCI